MMLSGQALAMTLGQWIVLAGGGPRQPVPVAEALILMTGLADELDAAIAEAVKGLRGCGYSWAEIGSRLGITRQAAHQRWG